MDEKPKRFYPNVSLDSILDILESFPTAVVLKDVQDNYRFEIWNKKAEEVTGLKKEAVLGKTDYELFPKDEADHFRDKDRFTITQKDVVDIVEESITTTSGKRWLQTRKLPVYASDGSPAHILVIFDDITEKKKQAALATEVEADKKAADELKALAEAIPQMVWTADAGGKIQYRNSKWAECMGVDSGLEEIDVHSIHPEDREKFLQIWKHSLSFGVPFQVEYRLNTASGYFWHLARAVPVIGTNGQVEKWFATSTDIHEQKKIENELRIAELRLKTILTSASVVLFSTDAHGTVNFIDGNGLSRFGVRAERLLHKSAFRVYRRFGWFCEGLRHALQGNSLSCEGDSPQGYFQVYFSPQYDDKKNFIGVIGLANDLTDFKNSEKERNKLVAREEAAIESSRLKSEFLANMSHEIRTPLNGLIGMAQALLDTSLSRVQRDCINTLLDSSDVLLHLINDILDISKIEAGKLEVKLSDIRLKDMVTELQTHFEHELLKKDLQIYFLVDSGVPDLVRTDELRLKQVFLNLIGNAIKFTASGEIRVQIIQRPGRILYFSIEDTGIGIDPEVQKKLFAPFTQGDSTLTKTYAGTGLGLAISKKLVELLGGQIGVTSQLGHGAKFWFTIPVVPHLQPKEPGKHAELRLLGMPAPKLLVEGEKEKVRVLLVEDNDVNRLVITMFMDSPLYELSFAENGREAVEAFKKHKYDVVLMDCQMPVMNGYDATSEIREFEITHGKARTPIVGITANAMAGDREKCLSFGMDDYLAKPIRKKTFIEVLDKWTHLDHAS